MKDILIDRRLERAILNACAGRQEGEHGEGHIGGDAHEELGDDTGQRHALIVGGHHQAHNARVERELQQDAGGTGGSIGNGVHIAA